MQAKPLLLPKKQSWNHSSRKRFTPHDDAPRWLWPNLKNESPLSAGLGAGGPSLRVLSRSRVSCSIARLRFNIFFLLVPGEQITKQTLRLPVDLAISVKATI